MRVEQIGNATLYLGKMEETIDGIQQVDHILADPPYLYIKTHDFDKEFDEELFFRNAKRFLPDDGFIALFGRGTSFYRWNTRLADLGFIFKEEIVWNKNRTSGITKGVPRVHETVSVHTKKKGKIRQHRIPYEEMRDGDYEKIRRDVVRLLGAIKTSIGLHNLKEYLEKKCLPYEHNRCIRYGITGSFGKTTNSYLEVLRNIEAGMAEKSIINLPRVITKPVHPTEKPVRLAERILALISDPGDTVYDPFMGSGSFGVACIRTGRKYIGSEMKPEYFNIARKRITEAVNETALLWENQEVV